MVRLNKNVLVEGKYVKDHIVTVLCETDIVFVDTATLCSGPIFDEGG